MQLLLPPDMAITDQVLIIENEYASDYGGELSGSKLFRGYGDLLFFHTFLRNNT